MKLIFKALPALAAAILLSSCGDRGNGGSEADDTGKIRVMVSVPPQADFVRRIGGEQVQIDVLVGDGQDPHTFSPTPAQMKALGRAQIYFSVGMPFEEALATKITNANTSLTLIDTSAGIEKIALQCEHPEHAHGTEEAEGHDEGHHEHAGHDEHEDDPHIWLAPNLIKLQVAHIAAALSEAAPEHAATFSANLSAFEAELDTLHAELVAKTEPHIGEKFFVFHPAFGYFGHTYGIDQVAVEIGGNSPTPKELAAFIALAKEQKVKVLFVQPQFDSRSAEVVAEQLGAKVVALDPLAPDVLENLRTIANAIVSAFGEERGSFQ
jgi:zinc transport system substrate-binding protein